MRALAALALAGLGAAAGVVLAAPETVVRGLETFAPEVLWSVPTEERVVALTIDDGPSPHTAEILDVLHAHGAQATFFLIGERVAERPEAARWIAEAGDEVANHAMEERATILLDPAELERSLERADSLIEPYGDPVWFRPGHGWFDREMIEEAAEEGYRVALASMLPLDGWLPWPDLVAAYVLHSARPGAVLVLHDNARRGHETAEILRRVLPELERRGYRVTTLSDLTRRAEADSVQ